jgi:hypothetical protein
MSKNQSNLPEVEQAEARRIAIGVLSQIDRSGWGTDRPDRWTPTFDHRDMATLARWVLASASDDIRSPEKVD